MCSVSFWWGLIRKKSTVGSGDTKSSIGAKRHEMGEGGGVGLFIGGRGGGIMDSEMRSKRETQPITHNKY